MSIFNVRNLIIEILATITMDILSGVSFKLRFPGATSSPRHRSGRTDQSGSGDRDSRALCD
jgi:hypothetical protein